MHYIINVSPTHSNTGTQNTTNTNITISGLPLSDTNYTVTIIPVNIIGYGPPAIVNGMVSLLCNIISFLYLF